MKIELTPALQHAFDFAQHLAARGLLAEVDLRHLLAGLLAEEEGKPVQLLTGAGADWPRVQAHLELPATLAANDSPNLPLHPAFREVMIYARELALQHGSEGSISTEHALLAIVSRSGTLREELEALGLDFARLRHTIVGETTPLILDEPLNLEDPKEDVDTARILDASANRAREALRVLEDHARFVLNDAFRSRELKQLRHALTQAIQLLPASMLLAGRDTLADVGTTIRTDGEYQRASLQDVAQANTKRLQEALRSLEEYGKILNVVFAEQIEKIRYQSYTLERALVLGGAARARLADLRLCVLVTDALCKASLVGTVKEAILGGAQMIQLREKSFDDRTLLAKARDVCQLAHANGALFIVNDRPDIARLSDADGVHLGQDDMSLHDARRILGPDTLIGVSTHNLDQVRRAVLEGADYLGVGPTFPSKTKEFADLAGLDFVRQACAETSLPAFAIGGIHGENIAQVVAVGATRVAVSNAVCAADDPRAIARQLRAALTGS
jgi:thiamine-phosphate pyrophosphorylase